MVLHSDRIGFREPITELVVDIGQAAQAARAPFHAVLSRVARYDTGNPVGFLEAAIAFALRDPEMGPAMKEHLASLRL